MKPLYWPIIRKYSRSSPRLWVFFLAALFVATTLFTTTAFSSQLTLAWDASSSSNVAGYRLYYGISSGNYPNTLDAALATTYTVTNLQEGQTYFFAVKAYDSTGLESDFSNEVSHFLASAKTITASAGANGTISPSGTVTVDYNGSQSFSITPQNGYHIDDVLVDGASVGAVNSYLFSNVTANHSISSTFAVNTYSISASAAGNGSITPSGSISVNHGGSQGFSITPQSGYQVAGVLVDGQSVGAVTSYSFTNIMASHTIAATFVQSAVVTHTIVAASGVNGTVSPSGPTQVNHGASQSFTFSPAAGYKIDDVLVDGYSVGTPSSYSFSNVTADHSVSASFKAANEAPFADAGPDQKVNENDEVTLNGLNSTDIDDGIASYRWSQLEGTPVTLTSTTKPLVTFNAPNVAVNGETLRFQLTVTDKSGLESTDTCLINVTWVNEPPVAAAGPDQRVEQWAVVTLSGSGSIDADDGIAQYKWQQIGGTSVSLIDSTLAQPTFTAPSVDHKGVALTFQLTVSDYQGLQSRDTCIVNVTSQNNPPRAKSKTGASVRVGEAVSLDASESIDPDNDQLSYRWTQMNGKPVTLSDPVGMQPSFTAPEIKETSESATFLLTVSDEAGLKSSSVCTIQILSEDAEQDQANNILWVRQTDGLVSLWTLDEADNFISERLYSPFNGWKPISYQQSVDGAGRILWVRQADGLASLWTLNAAGNFVSEKLYGPFNGWSPTSYYQNTDGSGRILWVRSSDGLVSLWTLNNAGSFVSEKLYGPFAGWKPTSYQQNIDGSAHILWVRSSDGLASLWTLNSAGSFVSEKLYGPFAGWKPTSYQQNADGSARILWVRSSDGLASLWSLDSASNFVGERLYGPFASWAAQAYD